MAKQSQGKAKETRAVTATDRRRAAKKKLGANSLEQRLSALELAIGEMQQISIRAPAVAPVSPALETGIKSGPKFLIRAHFGRIPSERKPFVVTLEGVERHSHTLSAVRAAILLVLLIDLLERSETGVSSGQCLARISAALSTIAPDEFAQSTDDSVRVAFYRAGQFVKSDLSGMLSDELTFDVVDGELLLFKQNQPIAPENLEIEITTSDQLISSHLDNSLATSPLARLRKSKALFVPPGDEGQDRLLLELLDHEFPVKQSCMFYRPTIQSFSPQLLAKMGVRGRRLQRQQRAMQGYQSGRLSYLEVLPRKVLWDMVRRVPGKGFALYPSNVNAADIISHLDHMQFLVRSVPAYELIITDAFLPFYITTFEIIRPDGIEHFTLFFQFAEENNTQQVSVFALRDDAVFFSSHEKIINWILSHPTTVRSRDHVLSELEAVRASLLASVENPTQALPANRNSGVSPSESRLPTAIAAQLEIDNVKIMAPTSLVHSGSVAVDSPKNRRGS